jgi:predicted SprT family Zn-dependent metalloprotease
MDRTTIKAKVVEIVEKANRIYPNLRLTVPTVGFYSKGGHAGLAYCQKNRLEFNEVLAKENASSFVDTIIHEVAHLVTHKVRPYAKQAHGPEFKAVDKSLGGRGTRCHSYDVSSVKQTRTKIRYEVVCTCQSHWVTKKTVLALQNPRKTVSCKSCGSKVEYTGKSKSFI